MFGLKTRQIWVIFTLLKLWVAVARHSWVKKKIIQFRASRAKTCLSRSWSEKARHNKWVFNYFPERLHSFISPNYRTKRALCVGAARGIKRCLVPVEWSCLEQIADSNNSLRYEGNCEYTRDYGGKARPNRWVSNSWFKQSELQREDNSIVWLQRERKPLIYSCFIVWLRAMSMLIIWTQQIRHVDLMLG